MAARERGARLPRTVVGLGLVSLFTGVSGKAIFHRLRAFLVLLGASNSFIFTDFVQAARRALSGSVPVLATIAFSGGGFIADAKRMPGVELIELTRENRDRLPSEIAARLAGARPLPPRCLAAGIRRFSARNSNGKARLEPLELTPARRRVGARPNRSHRWEPATRSVRSSSAQPSAVPLQALLGEDLQPAAPTASTQGCGLPEDRRLEQGAESSFGSREVPGRTPGPRDVLWPRCREAEKKVR